MKKVLALVVTVAMIATMFASLSISAADNAPIVFDFSKDGNYTRVGGNDADGDNWTITLPGNVVFMAKKSKTRISYEYDAAEGAAKFTAQNGDAYFVSSDEDAAVAGNDANLPEAYQIDTSVYKYMKIKYKKNDAVSNNVSQGYFFFLQEGAGYEYATNSLLWTYESTGEWNAQVYDLTTLEPFGVPSGSPSKWTDAGLVKKIRFNLFSSNDMAKQGDEMWIEYIAFFATEEEANAYGETIENPGDNGDNGDSTGGDSGNGGDSGDSGNGGNGGTTNAPTGDGIAVVFMVAAAAVVVTVILKKKVFG